MICFYLIIPTLNAGPMWIEVIKSIQNQQLFVSGFIEVIVIDSKSTDGTTSLAQQAGFKVQSIDPASFGHGSTRQEALEQLPVSAEFVFFITQDVILQDKNALEKLLNPFSDSKVSATFGRQLPHQNATWWSKQIRAFNYPSEQRLLNTRDPKNPDLKTIFISNSFAAYRLSSVKKLGGFPSSAILGEDMLLASKIIKVGQKIIYVPQAEVRHSHNYTFLQEFQRYFDIGVMHAEEQENLRQFGGVEIQGLQLLGFLYERLKELNFYSLMSNALQMHIRLSINYLGYYLGNNHKRLPIVFKKKLSMSKNYWSK